MTLDRYQGFCPSFTNEMKKKNCFLNTYPLGERPARETLERALPNSERAGAFTKNKPT